VSNTDQWGEAPQFARSPDTAELRGQTPRYILDVLDAVSIARGMRDRMQLVNKILGEWADKVLHETSLVQRIAQRNPSGSDTGRRE